MATEYGFKYLDFEITWTTREHAEHSAREYPNTVVVAREVSEPRIVSIRA